MMSDCQHEKILTWRSTDGEPVRLWSCTECNTKFVPITNELRLERDLAAAVERIEQLSRVTNPERHELDALRELMRDPKAKIAAAIARAERAESYLRAISLEVYQGGDPSSKHSACRPIIMKYAQDAMALAAKETPDA